MRKREGAGHRLLADNFSSSPVSFQDLTNREINCHVTVCPSCKGVPFDSVYKTLKMRYTDTSQKPGKLQLQW
jgi:hypothetical protein